MSDRNYRKRLYAWLICLVWLAAWMVTGLKAWTARRFDLLTVAVVILLVSAGGLVLILVSSGPGQFSINTSRETGHESGSDRTGGENRRPV